ncbi:MAG: GNAT family N-acetyltransferase [Planctomycetaceae bacterium]|nr:GNAT family N-acetyltransferase [Planctomycetaceae bacterium]
MIRAAEPRDFDRLVEVAIASALFEAEQSELISQMLRSQSATEIWLTAEVEEQPVGVACLTPEKMTSGTWNLLMIAVPPSHQRKGVGKSMFDYVQSWIATNGGRMLIIETAGDPAFSYVRTFYAREGFEQEATIRDFYEKGGDRVVFRRLVDPLD